MSDDETHKWILPASIPFPELKGKDLEECVYWLLDAMGAKDLEWRKGGTGGGAADGGRDLEARLFAPDQEGELQAQKWWIECKGRAGTVEPDEVKAAVNNALAFEGLDCLVVATNTQFSNPTRDWVKVWETKHPRPRVQLWDHTHLERYLSRHPDVVLRLFSEALSLQGRFQAMENRFWNKLEFVTPKTLADLWKERRNLDVNVMGVFAAIANEFANGDITHRPWGATLDTTSVVEVLSNGLYNFPYLAVRSLSAGIEQGILFRTLAYLILLALDSMPADATARLVIDSLNRSETKRFPDEVQELLLLPVVDQLLSEMQDVCSEDCKRISAFSRSALTKDKDEVDNYWLRLEPAGLEETPDNRRLLLEKQDAPCVVGFPVDADRSCPLFEFEPTIKNVDDFMAIIKRVAAFRKAQAAFKRRGEERKKEMASRKK
jgi:hypothetical protein